MSKALGLVEVRGYVAAVEAADSALKAANVTLIGLEKIKGGITTIKITGDVGAVKAAVDAARASVESLGTFRTAHVIPRVDSQVQNLFFEGHKKSQEVSIESSSEKSDSKDKEKIEAPDKKKAEASDKEKVETSEVRIVEKVTKEKSEVKEETKEVEPQINKIEENIKNDFKDHIDYNSMKVEELRRLVRTLKIPNMTNKQIKFAKKDVLIKTILEYNKAGEK
ncbi:BMC domain-containing protein [uncultured Clostridium sp.]|uniref:BMC domain-containing protein n=1 Tax=uncultured Clostridium sp. TaxID=59620 RepID=UPI0032180596